MAATRGHIEVVCVLHKHEADPSIANKHGAIPVHMAAEAGHKDVVKLFRKLGADVAAPYQIDGQQYSAADLASHQGHTALAKKLARYHSQCACCEEKRADVRFLACGRCKTTFYCSAACQKQDWPQHKQTCQPPSTSPSL